MKTLEEARAVSEEERTLLEEAKQIVQGFFPTAEILLYGSAARGTHGPESDYDLLVLTDAALSTKEEDRVRDAVYDLQVSTGTLISTVFYSKVFWGQHAAMPFHQEVDKDAILL